MQLLKDALVVAVVAGICSSLALACFWWAGHEARLAAAIAASVASAIAVIESRSSAAAATDSEDATA